jgi:hypothetical protein
MTSPAAMQSVELVHDTPNNRLLTPAVGPGLMDQAVPSQVSIKLGPAPAPTATQELELTQEMLPNPAGAVAAEPVMAGLGTTDQVVPSHLSTRGCCSLDVVALL